MPRKKPSWKPATEFKVTKLARNGPKNGQNVSDWEKGKEKGDRQWQRKADKYWQQNGYS